MSLERARSGWGDQGRLVTSLSVNVNANLGAEEGIMHGLKVSGHHRLSSWEAGCRIVALYAVHLPGTAYMHFSGGIGQKGIGEVIIY